MKQRYVICPRCKEKALYSKDNPFRPFCSERCKLIDLGAWADESYRVPSAENSTESMDESDKIEASSEEN